MPLQGGQETVIGDFAPELPSFLLVGAVVTDRSFYKRVNWLGAMLVVPALVVSYILAKVGRLPYSLEEMLLVTAPAIVLLTPLHEGTHWLVARLGGVPARHCRFGMLWSQLMPYFRSLVPLPVRRYRLVLLGPGVGLTVVAALIAIWQADLRWWLVAWVAFAAGLADYYWYWRLRDVPNEQWVWDRAGVVGIECLSARDP